MKQIENNLSSARGTQNRTRVVAPSRRGRPFGGVLLHLNKIRRNRRGLNLIELTVTAGLVTSFMGAGSLSVMQLQRVISSQESYIGIQDDLQIGLTLLKLALQQSDPASFATNEPAVLCEQSGVVDISGVGVSPDAVDCVPAALSFPSDTLSYREVLGVDDTGEKIYSARTYAIGLQTGALKLLTPTTAQINTFCDAEGTICAEALENASESKTLIRNVTALEFDWAIDGEGNTGTNLLRISVTVRDADKSEKTTYGTLYVHPRG